ncbi:MAG: DNA repair protein RecN [Pseudomonadales bacterium]|nr:DNA repair protein RecN [Pseudomonadales bacterium]
MKSLELNYGDGLTVITGETGAGKSIMVDALALALGGRTDPGVVRHGEKRAEVTAAFNCDSNKTAQSWLEAHELDQDGECILRRTISTEGRSRAYINGTPVTAQSLKDLSQLLVNIHGQHEHQTLLRRETQRELLDHFASLQTQVITLKVLFKAWQGSKLALQTLKDKSRQFSERHELLSYQVKELNDLALQEGELDKMEQEHQRLANVGHLQQSSFNALQLLRENEKSSAQKLLSDAKRELKNIPPGDSTLDALQGLLESVSVQLEEACCDLDSYLSGLENNPERLQYLDERIGLCHQLARKHRLPVRELTNLHLALQKELEELSGCDDRLASLMDEEQKHQSKYHKLAQTIGKTRKIFAVQLEHAINKRLAKLGMAGASLAVSIYSQREHASAHGYEQVEFLVATNPGQPPKPLNKVASGGELSRISLAIQAICAEKYATPTLIFDEVDVGIGGSTASVVGKMLRKLGDNAQVLCVTHQAQVASQAHHHYSVRKVNEGKNICTEVISLDGDDKVTEIARMLGGDAFSPESLEHARVMLEA